MTACGGVEEAAVGRGTFDTDACMTKLIAEGWVFVYSTDLGGLASDYSDRMAVDAFDNAYVRYVTNSNRAAGDVVRQSMLLWPKRRLGAVCDESS
jgi:hypothetical protein